MGVTAVAVALGVLAVLDGSFAGFRASLGRTGRIDHRRSDILAGCRGALLVVLLLAPTAALVGVDAARGGWPAGAYAEAGAGMLAVYVPYGSVALLAIAAYLVLGWRRKYLASALILGPFTLVRPVVALVGAAVGVSRAGDQSVAISVAVATVGVLLVEPLAGRLWYATRRVGARAGA